jgi:hypothetical protein
VTPDVFVIADAHGNAGQVLQLLRQEGLVTEDGTRTRGDVLVVQIGDLANCVEDSEKEDLEALALVGPVINLMLVGNHEHPYFGGPSFWGFWHYETIKQRLLELDAWGLIQPSLEVNGILVTHAGLSSHWGRRFRTAAGANSCLRRMWRNLSKNEPIFSAIGQSRGGRYSEGGVLWSDWSEPKRSAFRQLVGHTVGKTIRRRIRATCIDLGGGKYDRIAGAWICGERIKTVICETQDA